MRAAPALAVLAVLTLASPARAQDIEAVARMRGLTVPKGYFRQLERDPTAFTLPNGLFRVADGIRVASRSEGTVRFLVLPALFSDSREPHITREMVQASLFDGPAPRGTITEAYREMSRGALTVTGDVLGWVRTSRPMAEVVGASSGLGDDAKVGDYLIEALQRVDSTVDFGYYDSDGPDGVPNSGDDDGYVDAMTFEFLEIAGSCGGPSIWPHRWGISGWTDGHPYVTNDLRPDGSPVKVDGYIIQSVADCSGQGVQGANVISHEFGHVLGLPDYYHPTAQGGADGRRWVLGCWSLMAAGSWGCGPVGSEREPFGPTHMVAYSKKVLGWVQLEEVEDVRNHEVVLEPIITSGKALRIPLNESHTEYLQIEYRARMGFDHQLPADGVLIYHKDVNGQRRPDPGSEIPYFLRLLEQDDNDGLVRNTFEGGNRGEAGDAWGVGGVSDRLNILTSPSTRAHSGVALPVTIHSVAVENGVARIVLSTAAKPELVSPEEPWDVQQVTPFERRVRIAGGMMPYSASGVVPTGVTLTAEQDELVVSGSIFEGGRVELVLHVTDAHGNPSPDLSVGVSLEEYVMAQDRVLQPLLLSSGMPPTDLELRFLDETGNRNGRLDVGDVRAWLREYGSGQSRTR